jgi:hypothetical protein
MSSTHIFHGESISSMRIHDESTVCIELSYFWLEQLSRQSMETTKWSTPQTNETGPINGSTVKTKEMVFEEGIRRVQPC